MIPAPRERTGDPLREGTGDPELALLLLCARPRACAPSRADLAAAAGLVTDWDRFFELARYHDLVPLVSDLHRRDPFLPEVPARRAEEATRGNAARSLRYCAALVGIVGALKERGIAALALKGPALSLAAYGDLGLRSFSDLDVLIRPDDLERALGALRTLGYHPVLPAERRNIHHPPWSVRDITLQHAQFGLVLELQWRLARSRADLSLPVEEVFAGSQPLEILDRQVAYPGYVHQFLHLCSNAANHGWSRLERVRALAELATQHPDINRVECLVQAQQRGVGRRARIAVSLLEGLAVPWDLAVLSRARADRQAVRLARVAQDSWGRMETRRPGDTRSTSEFIQSLDSRLDRARYAAMLAFAPDKLDWTKVPLPRCLQPLYCVIRPARLAGRSAGRLLGP